MVVHKFSAYWKVICCALVGWLLVRPRGNWVGKSIQIFFSSPPQLRTSGGRSWRLMNWPPTEGPGSRTEETWCLWKTMRFMTFESGLKTALMALWKTKIDGVLTSSSWEERANFVKGSYFWQIIQTMLNSSLFRKLKVELFVKLSQKVLPTSWEEENNIRISK